MKFTTLLKVTLVTLAAMPSVFASRNITLTFDHTPAEQGIIFDRAGVSPSAVEVDGQKIETWVSGPGSVPADEWARSFLLRVDDPAFRSGKMPMVDVEIQFYHDADTKVSVLADTKRGPVEVASGWGNRRELQTLSFRLDDALFGDEVHEGDPKSLPLGDYDLRINAAAGDFHLRSVVISGQDLTEAPDFYQLLKVREAQAAGGAFIANENQPVEVQWTIENLAHKECPAHYRVRLIGSDGQTRKEFNGRVDLAAASVTPLDLKVVTDGLAAGLYDLILTLHPADDRAAAPYVSDGRQLIIKSDFEIFILFDEDPVEHGLEFRRFQNSPGTAPFRVGPIEIWEARTGSSEEFEWGRSFYLTVAEDAFRDSRQSAVDIEILFRQESNAPVRVFADTTDGPKEIGGSWGNNQAIQGMSLKLNNARFGGGLPGGYDLRIDGFNSDLGLRSVRISGFDLEDDIDYQRLLILEDITASKPIFAFEAGSQDVFDLQLKNAAAKPMQLRASFTLTDPFGEEKEAGQQTFEVPAGETSVQNFQLDTTGMLLGVHTLGIQIQAVTPEGDVDAIQRSVNFAVHETGNPPKAADGEFYFGLDAMLGAHFESRELMMWSEFMGADLFRHAGVTVDNIHGMKKALDIYEQYKMRTSMIIDIPYAPDAAERSAAEDRVAAQTREFVTAFRDDVQYFELGNEPDLTYFYPGPIANYLEGYLKVQEVIKELHPDSIVMNGGLSFFGEDGFNRSREFVENVPSDRIDAFAYHAHGPGVEAEREAYERIRKIAAGVNKADKPFIDTESGVSARTPRQERIQARTVIQKMAFAWSVGSPTFHWFRLYMTGGEAGYSSLLTGREPRPVMSAYRTAAWNLKGKRFIRTLQFPRPGFEAYLFASEDETERTLLLWATEESSTRQDIQLGANQNAVPLTVVDLFGNRSELHATAGVASVDVSADPVFLHWSADGPLSEVAIAAGLIETPHSINIVAGTPMVFRAQVNNRSSQLLNGELTLRLPSQESPLSRQVSVPANSSSEVAFEAILAESGTAVAWPQTWNIFTGFEQEQLDPANFNNLPEKVSAGGREIRARRATLFNHTLDLSTPGQAIKEGSPALVFAEVTSPVDQTVSLGASADWWMACYVNAELVFDTLSSGNEGGYAIDDHVFEVKLKKGSNLVTFLVLSGSQGWKLLTAGPAELDRSSDDQSTVLWELKSRGQVLASQSTALRVVPALPILEGDLFSDSLACWTDSPLPYPLDGGGIHNRFEAFPDSSKWYRGSEDLSGSAWVGLQDGNLIIVAAVTDDVDVPEMDMLEIALATPGSGAPLVFQIKRDASGATQVVSSESSPERVQAVVSRENDNITLYRVAVSLRDIKDQNLLLNLRVHDSDADEIKQTMQLMRGWEGDPPAMDNALPLVIPAK